MTKKREHHCDLRLRRRGGDVDVFVDCCCKALVVAKIEGLPDMDAADVSHFELNKAAQRCPATRLALCRAGMDSLLEESKRKAPKKRGGS